MRLIFIFLYPLLCLLGGCIRNAHAQQIIGRPMLPLNSAVDPSAISLTNGLQNYWRLDETSGTRTDIAGAVNLTDVNTVTSTTGKQTNAAVFVAANTEYLERTGGAGIPGGQTFSYAFWFQTSSLNSQRVIINGWNNVSADTHHINRRADNKMEFAIHAGGIPGTYQMVTNSTTVTTGTWYFLYCERNQAGGTIKISINNGTADSATDGGISIPTTSDTYRIGNYINASLPWDGLADEVGIWSRILTAAELTYLYNAGAGRAYTPGAAIPFH